MKSKQKISFLLCFLMLTSCYQTLDFDQLDNYVLKPVYTSPITYFTVLPFQFFDSNGIQQFSISEESEFPVFENSFFRDNVVKLDFNLEIRNEFDRNVILQIELIDNNNNSVYNFNSIEIDAGELNYSFLEEIETTTNLNLTNTAKIRITAFIENTGTPMNSADTSEFVLKSSATIYIESSL
ncbi:hypothetical protein [uncultured Polaribacter sp.]|uniref:hypothetical protein n=1 Tax=uncultured Polaribacter sp. TaxID=174711 RepID=UPI00262C2054|nr:hypothetical protein [uncultured Polaribacter sp.]